MLFNFCSCRCYRRCRWSRAYPNMSWENIQEHYSRRCRCCRAMHAVMLLFSWWREGRDRNGGWQDTSGGKGTRSAECGATAAPCTAAASSEGGFLGHQGPTS
jgi:hypothetical protein